MNFLETLHEILISLCIAILLPINLYLGINLVYENPTYPVVYNYQDAQGQVMLDDCDKQSKKDAEKLEIEAWQKSKSKFDQATFLSSVLFGFLLILTASVISIKTISVGLVIGGILNILMGLFFIPKISALNFMIFLALLLAIIFMVVIKKNKRMH